MLPAPTPQGPGALVVDLGGRPGAEAERELCLRLLNLETAYWDLHRFSRALASRERGLSLAREVIRLAEEGYRAGRLKAADLAQSRGQYDLFADQRLRAPPGGARVRGPTAVYRRVSLAFPFRPVGHDRV